MRKILSIMKKLSIFLLSLFSVYVFSQFVTPGTGINYNLSSLSVAAPSVLVNNGTYFQMTANITISPNDTLLMDESNATLKIDGGVQLTIGGTYDTSATNIPVSYTHLDVYKRQSSQDVLK